MRIRTNKEADFTETDFANICVIKKMLIKIFDEYKRYWHRNDVKTWDYEIKEHDNDTSTEFPYAIEIFCGIEYNKVCIIRQLTNIIDVDFAKRCRRKELLWEQVLIDMGIMGAEKMYQNIIIRDREQEYKAAKIQRFGNPLTPKEFTSWVAAEVVPPAPSSEAPLEQAQ